MVKFICNKLSRDKTLLDMKNAGIRTTHTILENEDLHAALHKKLIEECNEVILATDRTALINELADVLEVIDGICNAYGIAHKEIVTAQKATRAQRGGFKKGIFVQTIEMDEDNQWVKHFRKSPGKYPEID